MRLPSMLASFGFIVEVFNKELCVICDKALPNMQNPRTFIRIFCATGEHEHPLPEKHDCLVECSGLLTMETLVRRDSRASFELQTTVAARDTLRRHVAALGKVRQSAGFVDNEI